MRRFICTIPRATPDEVETICEALSKIGVGWYHFGGGMILIGDEAPDSELDIEQVRSIVEGNVKRSRSLIYGLESHELIYPLDEGRSSGWLNSHFGFTPRDEEST